MGVDWDCSMLVRTRNQDGTIQTEHTYGKDPYPPPG